ncbi:hypothetical protein [uncultured Bradyrhizobium sp.]|uniref:hypothetical protein n=1 Tax=uncultured Bradyrhizobium sp. TaxID=199684 RepID=UPI0027D9BFB7|nr:hypothetical protein [uncultured Bradyrhizobium sp.]
MELRQAAQLLDHGPEDRVVRRRRVQIVDVAHRFEALSKRREDTDIVIMGIRDLQQQTCRLVPCEAVLVDNPYQRHRRLRLVTLGLSQRLNFLRCRLLAVRLSLCDGVACHRTNLVGSESRAGTFRHHLSPWRRPGV